MTPESFARLFAFGFVCYIAYDALGLFYATGAATALYLSMPYLPRNK